MIFGEVLDIRQHRVGIGKIRIQCKRPFDCFPCARILSLPQVGQRKGVVSPGFSGIYLHRTRREVERFVEVIGTIIGPAIEILGAVDERQKRDSLCHPGVEF